MNKTEQLTEALELAYFWLNVLVHTGELDLDDSNAEKLGDDGEVIETRNLGDALHNIGCVLGYGVNPYTPGEETETLCVSTPEKH